MSTPSITIPGRRQHGATVRDRAAGRLRLLARGASSDPPWSRPALWLVATLAGVLTLWGLTRSGYANTYYAEAAQAATRSWKALLENALDVGGYVSLDKGPLSNVLMGVSGRIFGFSSFSMLLPEALCGIASVLVLHATVKRAIGPRAALLAALMLALTPISVAMSRFNNPDALLILCEVSAAWALVRALESGRLRHLVLCGVLVGLAFNTKMLQAYLVVPAMAITFLIAGRAGLGRRIAQLAAAGAAMFAVSFAWYGAMMLLPAGDRPWVGDTTDDSWFSLIFGANGLSRVSGGSGAAGPTGAGTFGGAPGVLRLFNPLVGGQIAWLLPLAAAGLAVGVYSRRRAPRTDLARAHYLLWGGWAAVSWLVFSFSSGVFHPYYTSALAPAVAALAAGGLVEAWDRSRRSIAWAVALAAAVVATAALAAALLHRTPTFVPWLGPLAVALALAFAVMLAWRRAAARASGANHSRLQGRAAALIATAGLVAVLAGPASYAVATVGKSLNGGNPLAGPSSVQSAAGPGGGGGRGAIGGGRGGSGAPGASATPGGPGALGGAPPAGAGASAGGVPFGAPPGARRFAGAGGFGARGLGGAGFGGAGGGVSTSVLSYLKAHQGSATYMVAAEGSQTAGSIAVDSGRNVLEMGGFMGSDPAPTLAQLIALVHAGKLRYVLLSSSSGAGGRGFGGPGSSSSTTSAITRRDAWIRSHGKVVKTSSTSSTGALQLYDLSGAA